MENGYIKLNRALKNWRYAAKPNYVALWVHLLLKANHKDKEWNDIVVHRGELVTSLESLSKDTGISKQTIRTIISKLDGQEITYKSTNKYTLISIVKYDEYQSNGVETNTQTNNQLTNNQQTTNKQLTTNKNIKNEKNDKNINNIYVCPELSHESSAPTEQPKYKIPLKEKNTYHPIFQSDLDHYQEYYPTLNVEQQIRSMVMWSESNPSNRKTKSGIKAFITRWLNKEHNKLGYYTSNDKKGDSIFYDTN